MLRQPRARDRPARIRRSGSPCGRIGHEGCSHQRRRPLPLGSCARDIVVGAILATLCWGGALLGRRSAGATLCWGDALLGRRSAGAALYWGDTLLGRRSAGAMLCWRRRTSMALWRLPAWMHIGRAHVDHDVATARVRRCIMIRRRPGARLAGAVCSSAGTAADRTHTGLSQPPRQLPSAVVRRRCVGEALSCIRLLGAAHTAGCSCLQRRPLRSCSTPHEAPVVASSARHSCPGAPSVAISRFPDT
jgi:hypothetical protein